jgi:ribonucleoside-diphosphate reductase alpha chain
MRRQPPPLPAISQQIWDMKYRLKGTDGSLVDATLDDTWTRVATAVAAAEPKRARKRWEKTFAEAMADLAFLPPDASWPAPAPAATSRSSIAS